jgi:hypothetical protein
VGEELDRIGFADLDTEYTSNTIYSYPCSNHFKIYTDGLQDRKVSSNKDVNHSNALVGLH